MPITVDQVLPELMGNTEAFLRHYLLRLVGNHGYSGTVDAWLIDRSETAPGFTTGLSGWRGRQKQRPCLDVEIGFGQPYLYDGGGRLSVWYVAMQEMNAAPVDTHFVLPSIGGPDIMMTAGLSGCTFGVGIPSGGAQIVSHIRPPSKQGGTQHMALAALDPLVRDGLTKGERALFSRSTQASYDDKASIIGVRRRGQWSFYAQTIRGGVDAQVVTSALRFA